MLRTVLFDVGGPLDTEIEHERRMDAAIRAAVPVSDAEYAAAARAAVDCFAPNTYQAIIWHLVRPDAARAHQAYTSLRSASAARDAIQLRAGIPELLADLRARDLKLGVVANQPTRAEAMLHDAGIARCFDYFGISETVGFHKPDPRIFLAACDALAVQPNECLMIGDRIDNDIVPARMLGMRTLLLRTGRHQDQQPRTWLEVPDFEVRDVNGIRAAIERATAQ